METLEVTPIKKADALEALNTSEIDIQIATAKQYPRDIDKSVERIVKYATVDEETAEECFYSLRRKNKNGADEIIEGPSVRLAEIVAASWGNLRVASQIIANDGRTITARGVCHDLETNVAVSSEVQSRICTKEGKTYSEDMQIVTGNAAGAKAFRNAVFKVVPKATISRALKEIKEAAKGDATKLEETKQKMVRYFATIGVTEPMLLAYLEVESLDDITGDMVVELRGAKNAIKEGTATAKELFIEPYKEREAKANAKAEAKTKVDRVKAAIARQNEDKPEPGDMPLGL